MTDEPKEMTVQEIIFERNDLHIKAEELEAEVNLLKGELGNAQDELSRLHHQAENEMRSRLGEERINKQLLSEISFLRDALKISVSTRCQ